jgi:hypothetical protein
MTKEPKLRYLFDFTGEITSITAGNTGGAYITLKKGKQVLDIGTSRGANGTVDILDLAAKNIPAVKPNIHHNKYDCWNCNVYGGPGQAAILERPEGSKDWLPFNLVFDFEDPAILSDIRCIVNADINKNVGTATFYEIMPEV